MTIPQDVAADPWQIVADLQQRIAASHAEREALELALREGEERYSLAMRAINEGFYEWDVATSEMRYSPRVCELVGLAPEELRTMADWTDRIHPTDMPEFRKAILAHFKGETEWLEAEYRYRHADGTWHWARQHGIGLRNEAASFDNFISAAAIGSAIVELRSRAGFNVYCTLRDDSLLNLVFAVRVTRIARAIVARMPRPK
jgi:PAS domain S-box-containing protein